LDRTAAKRAKRRFTCELMVDGQRSTGIILDVSESGIFVQTATRIAPNTRVDVMITGQRNVPDMQLRAVVARQKRTDPRLVSVNAGGLGLKILDAPPSYYEHMVVREEGVAAPRPARRSARKTAAPAEAGKRFTVRVSQVEGTRTRNLEVTAASPEAARKTALDELGEGWEILEITPA
jgi:hypothetical protein